MEKNTLTLSIIVPIYNTPIQYIKECLESIKKSNIKYPYEIILVNDGSTEPSVVQFLRNLEKSNEEKEHLFIIHKENGGLPSARNAAIPHLKGEFVICLDSDDILLPNINLALDFLLDNPEYDVVYSDIQTFGDKNYKIIKGNFSKFKILYLGHITSASNLFRRTIFQKVSSFNESLVYAEDWDFWARVASAGYKFKYLPEYPYFLYRKIVNGVSVSQKNYDKREEIKSFIKSQFNPHKEITISEINKYVLNNFKDNKKHLIKLFLILLFPSFFKFLVKRGIYKNNIVVD